MPTRRTTFLPLQTFLSCVFLSMLASNAFAVTVGFEEPGAYPAGALPEDLAIGDINNDGFMDLVVANSDADSVGTGNPDVPNPNGGNSVTPLLGNGDGTFTHMGYFPTGDRPEGIVLAHINADTILDVVTSDHDSTESDPDAPATTDLTTVSVLLGNGDGTFLAPLQTIVPGGPRDVAAGDFNGDGHTDLATANYTNGTISILIGDSSGTFAVTQTLASGLNPEALVVGQLTADAHVDLVVANRARDKATSTIRVFVGDGTGAFTADDPIDVEDETRNLAIFDLDGDGLDDLFASSFEENKTQIFKNLGAGALDLVGTLVADDYLGLAGVDVADLNEDGRPDVIVTAAGSERVHVFFGRENPFASRSHSDLSLVTGDTPINARAVDLTGTGHFDLVVTEGRMDRARVFRSYLPNPGVIVDNGDPGTSSIGQWNVSEGRNPFDEDSLSSSTGATYTWVVPVATPGDYEVLVWWTVTENRLEAVPVDLVHSDGIASMTLDQTSGHGLWVSLGEFRFEDSATVVITAPNGGSLTANADAVRLVAVGGQKNAQPVANLGSISPDSAVLGTEVRFTGSASDSDGTIDFVRWTSDLDGFLSNARTFSTTNLSAGVHRITLVAVDNLGATSAPETGEVRISETESDPPVASAGDDLDVDEGDSVTLDASGSQARQNLPLTYFWEQLSGKSVILEDADQAVAVFKAPAVLSEETLVFQVTVTEGSLSNAATVTVRIHDSGVGMATFTTRSRPSSIAVDGPDVVLAFHGNLNVANDAETTDWTGATFTAIGNDDPGSLIVQCWLYVDSNGNQTYDEADRQLGAAEAFNVATGEIRFNGFLQTLFNGQPRDFFVVCERAPKTATGSLPPLSVPGIGSANFDNFGGGHALALGLALAGALLPLLQRGSRRGRNRLAGVAYLFLLTFILPAAGCGSGGGGGGGGGGASSGNETAQLQLIDVELSGTTSGEPAALGGLPVNGWEI